MNTGYNHGAMKTCQVAAFQLHPHIALSPTFQGDAIRDDPSKDKACLLTALFLLSILRRSHRTFIYASLAAVAQ